MKIFTTIISILFLSIALGINGQNAPITTLGTVSSTSSEAIVPVKADGFTDISSCALKIVYDPLIATPTNVSIGVGMGGTFDVNLSTPGEIRIGWYSSSTVTLTDGSTIFNIAFEKVTNGTTDLDFDDEYNGRACKYTTVVDGISQTLNDLPLSTYYISGSLTFTNQGPVTIAPTLTASVNDIISIPVKVTGFNNVGVVSLTLDYDPGVIDFLSASNTVGGFPSLSIDGTSVPGTIFIGGLETSSTGTTLADYFTLFTLNFKYLGGTTDLIWNNDYATACEYGGSYPDYFELNDEPYNLYYINGSVGPDPTTPTPTITVGAVTHPTTCGGDGTIVLNFTNVPSGTYTITYDGGSFEGVEVSGGAATITTEAGTYDNLRITVDGVTSAEGVNVELTEPEPVDPTFAGLAGTYCEDAAPTLPLTSDNGIDGTWSPSTVTATGDYVFTPDAGECAEQLTVSITLVTPATPLVEVLPADCDGAASVTVTNYDGGLIYTSTPAGLTVGAGGVVSGGTDGTSYTITAGSGDCTATSLSFIYDDDALDSPTLSLTTITCASDFQTYDIVFESNGTVESTAGTVTGNTVTGIDAGTDVTLTATLNGCTTELLVEAPDCGCPEIEITSIMAYPNEPVEINSPVVLTVNYSSSAPVDINISWDEGVTESFPDETDGIVTATHSYPSPGVYTVTVEATNECGNTETEIYEYVVVYNPDGGFVTGGGWFMSPPGAYIPDESITGKASFGFVAKYQKGRSKPSGHTEFQFRAANLNFNSTDYEWLVVSSDKKAQFQGTGTINGSGNYGFRISVVDGSKEAPDQLRIRIWDLDSGGLIYDNKIETEISSGSIVIHSPKFKSDFATSSRQIDEKDWLLDLNVFPNPFTERLKIEFVSPEDTNARIDIYDMTGRLVKTIFEQPVEAYQYYEAEFEPETALSGIYVYRLILGDKIQSGKVIFKKE